MASLPQSMRAIVIDETGDVDKLHLAEIPHAGRAAVPEVAEDQVLIKTEWAGINFIDTYFRGGLYPIPSFPAVLGNECAGTIAKLGSKVDPKKYGYNVGDKVASLTPRTSYAEYAVGPADHTGKLPESMSTKTGAAVLLQGLTALTNIRESHAIQKGEYALIHAAAGGLGLLLCQMCKAAGARVIGTTSTAEKAALAKKNGADEVILYKDVPLEEVAQKIKALTPDGQGVHVVYDGVGKDTFDMDFDILRRKGSLVSIGNASGAVPPVAPLKLADKNLKLTRPKLHNYLATRDEFVPFFEELCELVQSGKVSVALNKDEGYEFSTEGARQAHKDISSRNTTGKLLLKVA